MLVLARPKPDYQIDLTRATMHAEWEDLIFYDLGRTALLAGLRALAVYPGDAVIVPAYICYSTVEPMIAAGYRIFYIDVGHDLQLNPARAAELAEASGAKALLLVHYFGFPASFEPLATALRKHGVRIIEDCCHSFLTRIGGKVIGLQGDAAIYSMRKTLPVPDGGALRLNCTADRSEVDIEKCAAPDIRRYLTHRSVEIQIASLGWPNLYDYRIDLLKRYARRAGKSKSIQAKPQLPSIHLRAYLASSDYLRQISDRFFTNHERLEDGVRKAGLSMHNARLAAGCVPQWAVLCDPSERLVPWMRQHGVGATRWPWFELPVAVSAAVDDYPVSNELNRRLALLPIHQSIDTRQIDNMLTLLNKFAMRN
jgi:dTDP-4-amino-4,6-dideoxygalactose transaminase